MGVKTESESHVGRSWWERGDTVKLGCEEGWDKGLSVGNVGGASGLGKDRKIPELADEESVTTLLT